MNNWPTTAIRSCAGLRITDTYKAWESSPAWLAEMVRTVTSRLYAQERAKVHENEDSMPVAVHKAAITAQLSKIFGALYDESVPQFSGSWMVDLLVRLGDLGDIGNGYHLPRESRIVRLASGWGRIAGGLPIEASEHATEGIISMSTSSIGRLVRLESGFSQHDHDSEHSEVYVWLTETVEQTCARMWGRLPAHAVSRPTEDAIRYYNVGSRHGCTRGERWNNMKPEDLFVVARTGIQPMHYYLIVASSRYEKEKWFEIEREEARRWIMLAEKRAGITNSIQMSSNGHVNKFRLPDMLPGAWTVGMMACATAIIPYAEGGWIVEVKPDELDLLGILFRSANLQMI
jgi:hypothetical protein